MARKKPSGKKPLKGPTPKRKKPLPREAARYLRQGLQTRVTPSVKGYASQFHGSGLKMVRHVLEDLGRFRRKHLPMEELRKVYAKRSADDILRDRWIAFPKGERIEPSRYAAIAGCIDYNVVLCAVLRAKGIPAKFTRESLHSATLFFLNGRWYKADPTVYLTRYAAELHIRRGNNVDLSKIPGPVEEVPEHRLWLMEQAKQLGHFAEGLDAWDIGIFSLRSFDKYQKK